MYFITIISKGSFVFAVVFLSICVAQKRETYYTTRSGHHHLALPLTSRKCATETCTKIWCILQCQKFQTCASVFMHKNKRACQTFDIPVFYQDPRYVDSDDWDFIESLSDKVHWDDWLLVFRAQRDINIPVYSTWMNDVIYHDGAISSLKPGCVSMNTSLSCDAHYKSKVVTMWNQSGIKMVKVLLIKDSQVRQWILFDGAGTNKTSWFSQDHVINSTWTDLTTSTMNYFSVKGHPNTRRFFINGNYRGCPNDYSWMTVLDGNDHSHPCSWDNPSTIPKFLYTKKNRSTLTGTLADFEYGDVMAILVK